MGSGCSTDHRDVEEWCRPSRAPEDYVIKTTRTRKNKNKNKKREDERRRHLIEALSAEAQSTELLARVPGRICSNGSTSTACAFTQQGKKGTNQDAMVVWENFASRADTVFCGVFDGHGPYGHFVARRVRDTLPSKLMGIWKTRMRGDPDTEEEEETEEEDQEQENHVGFHEEKTQNGQKHKDDLNNHATSLSILSNHYLSGASLPMKLWRDCVMKAFRRMDRDLRLQPIIDSFCSGTTAVILLQQGKELMLGNVGDSRAVLATASLSARQPAVAQPPHQLDAIQLTVDLKPNLPKEAERIRKCKGRVFAMADEPEVARLWLPYDDAPGLAMARAFGDFCLKDYGLICVPDITYRTITPDDQFVILATDGIWDVMSNRQAVEVVWSAPTRATAARLLVETAVRAWRHKYPTSKVDDCAVICLFFRHDYMTSRAAGGTTSTYYYSEDSEDEEEEEEEATTLSRGRRSNTIKFITTPPQANFPYTYEASIDNRQAEEEDEEEEEEAKARMATIGTVRPQDTEQGAIDSPDQRREITTSGFMADMDLLSSNTEIQEIGHPSPNTPSMEQQQAAQISSPPRHSLAKYMSSAIDEDIEDWSALKGVVRVNTLLNLPRFKVGDTSRQPSQY